MCAMAVAGQTPDNAMMSSMETPKAAEARLPAIGKCCCHRDHVSILTKLLHAHLVLCLHSFVPQAVPCMQMLATTSAKQGASTACCG